MQPLPSNIQLQRDNQGPLMENITHTLVLQQRSFYYGKLVTKVLEELEEPTGKVRTQRLATCRKVLPIPGMKGPRWEVVQMEPRSWGPKQELGLQGKGLHSRCLNLGETQSLQKCPLKLKEDGRYTLTVSFPPPPNSCQCFPFARSSQKPV